MRLLIFAIGVLLAAAPARAQTYDPAYPVCLQTWAIGGGSIDCGFTSMPQCAASASGRSAQCLINPFFVGGNGRLSRQRSVY